LHISRAVWLLRSQDGLGVEEEGVSSIGLNGKNEATPQGKEIHLNAFRKLIISVFGSTRIGSVFNDGWKAQLPLYAFKCQKHGIQIAYPSGWQKTLQCPECIVELINKQPKKHRKK